MSTCWHRNTGPTHILFPNWSDRKSLRLHMFDVPKNHSPSSLPVTMACRILYLYTVCMYIYIYVCVYIYIYIDIDIHWIWMCWCINRDSYRIYRYTASVTANTEPPKLRDKVRISWACNGAPCPWCRRFCNSDLPELPHLLNVQYDYHILLFILLSWLLLLFVIIIIIIICYYYYLLLLLYLLLCSYSYILCIIIYVH